MFEELPTNNFNLQHAVHNQRQRKLRTDYLQKRKTVFHMNKINALESVWNFAKEFSSDHSIYLKLSNLDTNKSHLYEFILHDLLLLNLRVCHERLSTFIEFFPFNEKSDFLGIFGMVNYLLSKKNTNVMYKRQAKEYLRKSLTIELTSFYLYLYLKILHEDKEFKKMDQELMLFINPSNEIEICDESINSIQNISTLVDSIDDIYMLLSLLEFYKEFYENDDWMLIAIKILKIDIMQTEILEMLFEKSIKVVYELICDHLDFSTGCRLYWKKLIECDLTVLDFSDRKHWWGDFHSFGKNSELIFYHFVVASVIGIADEYQWNLLTLEDQEHQLLLSLNIAIRNK